MVRFLCRAGIWMPLLFCFALTHCASAGYGYQEESSHSVDLRRVLGVWDSNFGPVKIAQDHSQAGKHLMGVWVYQRDNSEVIGYFGGAIHGGTLSFRWHEPADPRPLTGGGKVVFDVLGASFSGQWWSDSGERQGEWRGWRPSAR